MQEHGIPQLLGEGSHSGSWTLPSAVVGCRAPQGSLRLQRNLTHGQLQPSHHFLPIACGWNHSEPWCLWPNPSEVKLQCREAGLYSGWGSVDPSLPPWCRLMPCAPNLRVQWSGSLSLYFSFLLICHYRCNPWMHSPCKTFKYHK